MISAIDRRTISSGRQVAVGFLLKDPVAHVGGDTALLVVLDGAVGSRARHVDDPTQHLEVIAKTTQLVVVQTQSRKCCRISGAVRIGSGTGSSGTTGRCGSRPLRTASTTTIRATARGAATSASAAGSISAASAG